MNTDSISTDMTFKYKETDLVFWLVSYDVDGVSYIYHNFEQVVDAISTFVSIEVSQYKKKQQLIDGIIEMFTSIGHDNDKTPSTGVTINDKLILVKKLVLDKHNAIHRILADSYDQVDDSIKKRINYIFQHSSC